jgi:hypothetical protein
MNHVVFCMDSLRWDSFQKGNAPNIKGFTDYKMVHSHAGCTPPSVFTLLMNAPWYGNPKEGLIPRLGQLIWLPRKLKQGGYYNALITPNPVFVEYMHAFQPYFDEYKIIWNVEIGSAKNMVKECLRIFDEVEQPKFVFLLFMETHQPYEVKVKRRGDYRPVSLQVKAFERLDPLFKRLTTALEGTNTEIVVCSDHGDLDRKIDGAQGHGFNRFHEKLFEVPLGRKTI